MEAPDINIKMTRDPGEGRGVFGRVDQMLDAQDKFNEAKNQGKEKDSEVIHSATEKGIAKVIGFVEKVGGGVEAAAKFADGLYRAAENKVKTVAENSWEIVQGLGEDTVDVLKGTARGALVGAKWAGIGLAVTAATAVAAPIVAAQSLGMGLVELGQHGAKGLAEVRAKVNGLILHGVHAAAAAIEAKALAGKASEQDRIETVRDQHTNRIQHIRDQNLGVHAVRMAKGYFNNRG